MLGRGKPLLKTAVLKQTAMRLSGVRSTALRLVNAHQRRRILAELTCGATWPYDQFTAAIGTNSRELCGHAFHAKRALERADARLRRFIRQIFVTAFAIRTQGQHQDFSLIVVTFLARFAMRAVVEGLKPAFQATARTDLLAMPVLKNSRTTPYRRSNNRCAPYLHAPMRAIVRLPPAWQQVAPSNCERPQCVHL